MNHFPYSPATDYPLNRDPIDDVDASARICPILSGPAILEGSRLRIRLGAVEADIAAPRKYLKRLYEWCDGRKSLLELDVLAKNVFKEEKFSLFIRELIKAGVLIDAAHLLAKAAESANNPSHFGRPAEKRIWQSAKMQLPKTTSVTKNVLPLPKKSELLSMLACRKSVSVYVDRSVSEDSLSSFLHAAYGGAPGASGQPSERMRRTVPSAGGFYRLHLNLILLRQVQRWQPGVYVVSYSGDGRTSLTLAHDDISETYRAFLHPDLLCHATGILVVSSDLSLSALKYRNRAYPFALIEAGAVLQNAALAAIALAMGLRVLGGFEENRLKRLCRLDREKVLASAVFGALANEDQEVSPTRLAVEFSWSNGLPDAPFLMGRARIATEVATKDFSWGRDKNAALAYNKAVAEAVERYAYHRPRDCVEAKMKDLVGAIDPRQIITYAPGQYQNKNFPFCPFQPNQLYLWVPARDVIRDRAAWVLADCVFHFDSLPERSQKNLYTRTSSSGCASHVSLELAMQTAILELVERDAFMRHWCAQRAGIEIRFDTLPLDFQKRLQPLLSIGCKVVIQRLDMAMLPVILVCIQHVVRHFTVVGAGSGLEIEKALQSALSEAETAAYAWLEGFIPRALSPGNVVAPMDHAELYARKQYYRKADALLVSSSSEQYEETEALFPKTSERLYAQFERKKMPVYIVDLTVANGPLTLEGKPLSTARALIPGLIPIAFGKGRMPLGMIERIEREALFPHPFP